MGSGRMISCDTNVPNASTLRFGVKTRKRLVILCGIQLAGLIDMLQESARLLVGESKWRWATHVFTGGSHALREAFSADGSR